MSTDVIHPYRAVPCPSPSCGAAVGVPCTKKDGTTLTMSHGPRRTAVWREAKKYILRVKVRVPSAAGFRRDSILLIHVSGNPDRFEVLCEEATGASPPWGYVLPDRKAFIILGFVAPRNP